MNNFFKILCTVVIIAAMLSLVGSFVNLYVGKGVIYRQGIFVNAIVVCGLAALMYGGVKLIQTVLKS